MSMTITLASSGREALVFNEDTGNGILKSLSPMTQSTYGAYAPGPVEIASASTVSKNGVTRMNISVRVPIKDMDAPQTIMLQNKGQPRKPAYAQVSLTVTLPSNVGIYGENSSVSGIPTTEASANLASVSLAMNLLLTLVGKQGALTSGQTIIVPNFTTGTFDATNPITRGLSGLIPVDPNASRDLISAT